MVTLGTAVWAAAWPAWGSAPAGERAFLIGLLATIALGLTLLLFGVRVLRIAVTIVLAGAGAYLGALLAPACRGFADRISLPHFEWLAAGVGAIIAGFLGFLLYRVWLIVLFGAATAAAAAGIYLAVAAPDEFQRIQQARQVQPAPADSTSLTRQVDILSVRQRAMAVRDALRAHPTWTSAAALAGLVVGLLLAGFAPRLAAILLTSVCGLSAAVGGLWKLALTNWPDTARQIAEMGWKSLLGPAGLWLIGVAVQVAVSTKPAEQPARDQPRQGATGQGGGD